MNVPQTTDLNFEILRVDFNALLMNLLTTNDFKAMELFVEKHVGATQDLKSALDQAFRDVLLHKLENDAQIPQLVEVVSACIECCRKGIATTTMPVILLTDLVELLTLDQCEKVFCYVESEVNVWKEDLFFGPCKNNLLRMCNDLLRRLSRSSATVFCGRILLFLAKFFPFSERSGLNIISEFNLENVTEYGTEGAEDIVTEIEVGERKNIVIDYTLYCKFWSLQDFFRNPSQCYNKIQWKVFCTHANSIISTFQGLKLDAQSEWCNNKDKKETYFSKYLTNHKLLDLQLYDVNFRRFVLVQFLILFQYLTSSVRFKADSHELKTDQREWVNVMTDKIYSLLRDTPPDGAEFSKIIKSILQREEQHWNVWKNDGCPEFRKALPVSEYTSFSNEKPPKKQRLGDIMRSATESGKYFMANAELTKLWNLCPDNLDACRGKDRDFLPSLETYLAEAFEMLDNNKLLTDEDQLLKDGNFCWRALRLLARRTPHFFMYSNSGLQFRTLSVYLSELIKKLASERPGLDVTADKEEPNNEVELEEEQLFKADQKESEINDDADDEIVENYYKFKCVIITVSQFEGFCEKMASKWKVLAQKLGYKPDDIEYIETSFPEAISQANHLLRLWFEDDEDSTLENFLYILEGLELLEAAEEVRLAIQQNGNLSIDKI